MDQRVAVGVGHGFHSFLQFNTIGQMLARCSAPYSGPKAAQVFVGPMAGCAGGQSARAGGSWHYYSWHGPVQCSVTSLHWKLNLNLAFEQVAARSTSWRSSARWEVAASPDPQMPNQFLTNTAKCSVKLHKSITVCPVRWT